MTIVAVSPSSQISPTMISTNPTSSHDEKPRFLSHVGAENWALPSEVMRAILGAWVRPRITPLV